MNTQRHLTAIAHNQYHPRVKQTTWMLYYSINKQAIYGPESYRNCKAEIKKLMASGVKYHQELFKIK